MASRSTRSGSSGGNGRRDDSFRRQAREAALQVLYALDAQDTFDDAAVETGLREYWAHLEARAPGKDYGDVLVRGVATQREGVDGMIRAANTNWRLERMARVDRNVLRIAAWEMVYGEVPPEVAIDEAIEVARRFGTAEAPAFVNGTLDKLATQQGKLARRA